MNNRLNICIPSCCAIFCCIFVAPSVVSAYYNTYQHSVQTTHKPYVVPPHNQGTPAVRHQVHQPYHTPPYAVSSYAAPLVPVAPATYESTSVPSTASPVYGTEAAESSGDSSSTDSNAVGESSAYSATLELDRTLLFETVSYDGTTQSPNYIPPTTPSPPSPLQMATVVTYQR